MWYRIEFVTVRGIIHDYWTKLVKFESSQDPFSEATQLALETPGYTYCLDCFPIHSAQKVDILTARNAL